MYIKYELIKFECEYFDCFLWITTLRESKSPVIVVLVSPPG